MLNGPKIMALVLLLITTSVSALGIGEITLSSQLNQNLEAKIPLIIAPGEKISNLIVKLAPPEKFTEAGVTWTPFLPKIKFETITGANNSTIIKLTSNEAVKEPYLNFLLQVLWQNGSLYREFTVLIDPPASYNPQPVSSASDQLISNYTSLIQSPELDTSVYGPTNKNDTLWKIAEQTSLQANVSVEQMMLAIYAANPRAFYKENIHALLAGIKLKIPEREIALKISRKRALEEYYLQTAAWKNLQAPLSNEPPLSTQTLPDKQLTLTAPSQEEALDTEVITSQSKKIADQNKDEIQTTNLVKEIVRTDAFLDNELKIRILTLEKQLSDMQQMLASKDQQLVALQAQLQVKASPPFGEVKKSLPLPNNFPITQTESGQKKSDNTLVIFIVFSAITLALTGWLLWRKHMKQSTKSDISASSNVIFDVSNTTQTDSEKIPPFFDETTIDATDKADKDQNEINPLAIADIYLAYGRYEQAEELIRDEIKDNPDNDELLLKLLEIYYLANKMEAFEAFAAKLASAGRKKDVEFWRTVTQMGSEICKDSVLFNHQFPIENIPHEIRDIPITHGDYLPMVTPVSNILSDNSVINHDQNQSNSVEFDISSPVLKQNEDEIGNTSVINQNDEASSLNNSNTNNPLQRNFYGTPIGSQINNEQMTHFDLTDMDEMETKLDLAKAYIDMSDIGSAKEMIAGVIMKGTEQQQLIAKNLLQDLKL